MAMPASNRTVHIAVNVGYAAAGTVSKARNVAAGIPMYGPIVTNAATTRKRKRGIKGAGGDTFAQCVPYWGLKDSITLKAGTEATQVRATGDGQIQCVVEIGGKKGRQTMSADNLEPTWSVLPTKDVCSVLGVWDGEPMSAVDNYASLAVDGVCHVNVSRREPVVTGTLLAVDRATGNIVPIDELNRLHVPLGMVLGPPTRLAPLANPGTGLPDNTLMQVPILLKLRETAVATEPADNITAYAKLVQKAAKLDADAVFVQQFADQLTTAKVSVSDFMLEKISDAIGHTDFESRVSHYRPRIQAILTQLLVGASRSDEIAALREDCERILFGYCPMFDQDIMLKLGCLPFGWQNDNERLIANDLSPHDILTLIVIALNVWLLSTWDVSDA